MPYFKSWTPPTLDLTRAVFSWNEWYAIFVHEGFTRKDGTKAPARRWTDAGIAEIDIAEEFKAQYQQHKDLSIAFQETCKVLNDVFQKQFDDPKWEWDRVTIRKNKSVVDSPRDIHDSGDLKNSQELEFF